MVFIVYLQPSINWGKFYKGTFCSLMYSKCLEQYLPPNKCSVTIYWKNMWMNYPCRNEWLLLPCFHGAWFRPLRWYLVPLSWMWLLQRTLWDSVSTSTSTLPVVRGKGQRPQASTSNPELWEGTVAERRPAAPPAYAVFLQWQVKSKGRLRVKENNYYHDVKSKEWEMQISLPEQKWSVPSHPFQVLYGTDKCLENLLQDVI